MVTEKWNYFLIVQQMFIKSKRSRLCCLDIGIDNTSTDYKQNKMVKPNDELPEEERSRGFSVTVTAT